MSDDGWAAGYGYDRGALVVARLGLDGSVAVERTARTGWRTAHGAPFPTVTALLRTESGFALEVDGDAVSARWWLFDGAGAERVGERHEMPALPARRVARDDGPEPEPTTIELALLERLELPWPVDAREEDWQVYERRARFPHEAALDPLGRLWISEFSTRVLHVFDRDGAELFSRAPNPRTFRPHHPCNWIAPRDDGSVLVCADRAIEEIGPAGELVRRTTFEDGEPRWLPQPGGERWWSVEPLGVVVLRARDGRELWRGERTASRRWLRFVEHATVAADGSLAILDSPHERGDDASTWVHVFGAEGGATRSVRLPGGHWLARIAYDGRRLARLVQAESVDELVLVDADGRAARVELPAAREGRAPGHVFLPPGSGEVWILRGRERLRLALP